MTTATKSNKIIETKEISEIVESEWAKAGSEFSPRSRADKVPTLPAGVYQFVPTLGGWYLDRTSHKFEFPFKVYSASDSIIKRIITYWRFNGGNLGVLMNGLRGAGKTMTAQLLANVLIKEQNLPVLVIKSPVPLQSIFDSVKQDLIVIFDEFEKTHDAESQQALLSTIDGMSRSVHNRLIVFTTNNPAIDENFKDRPSRIHYQFEFQRVADEIIEGLINDSLPQELHVYKSEIFDFLHSREICTIDIVKAVIAEVKTFKEPPLQFEDILNISKGEPPSFTISTVDPESNATKNTLCHFFKPDNRNASIFNGNKRAISEFIEEGTPVQVYHRGYDGTYILNLLEKCKEDKCWLAQVAVPKSKTPFDRFVDLYDSSTSFYMDNRPKDWKFPFTPESIKSNSKHFEKLNDLFEKCLESGTVYGSGIKEIFKIKIEPNKAGTEQPKWQITGKIGD